MFIHFEVVAMPASTCKFNQSRGEIIDLRISRDQKALIDSAAHVLGQKHSDFILTAVCREEEAVLLDRRYFALPPR